MCVAVAVALALAVAVALALALAVAVAVTVVVAEAVAVARVWLLCALRALCVSRTVLRRWRQMMSSLRYAECFDSCSKWM